MTRSIWIICLGMALAGCGATAPSEESALRSSRERWQARQPPAYEFVLQRSGCECLPEWLIPMRVTVREGQVRTVANLRTGETVSAEAHRAMSVDDLFALVEQALEQNAYRVSVSYDRDLGYPTSVVLDYDRRMVDDEVSYTARELRAVR